MRIVGDPLSREVILHGFHAWQNMANVSQGSSQVCKHHPVSTLWDVAGVVKVWYDGINQYPFFTNPMLRQRCHKGKMVCLHKICQRGHLTSQGQPVQVRVSSALVNGTPGIEFLLVDPGSSRITGTYSH